MAQRRDSKGRFAGGGGSSGGGGKKSGGKAGSTSKSATTRKANEATEKRLLSKGLTGTGSRLNKKTEALFQGSAKTKKSRREGFSNAEGNQRRGASNTVIGAQRSKTKMGGTISRKGR
jgi:hypothetical protein